MSTFLDRWDEAALQEALASGKVDARDRTGATPLWHAVYFGQVAWVERLLAAGARIDAHDAARIDRAAGEMHVVSIWRGLSEPGHPAPTGPSTLLHAAAARAGSPEIVERLLAAGVPVDAPDAFGCTPLHVAAFAANPGLVDLLIDRGANPDAIDRAGYTALDHGWSKEHVLARLLARAAGPDGGPHIPWAQSSYEWSALTQAAAFGQAAPIRALLAAGADLRRHPLALPLAAKDGHLDVVRLLLDAGAPLDTTYEWRGAARGPLACAAMYASSSVVARLLPRCRGELDSALLAAVQVAWDDLPTPPNDRAAARREVVACLLDAGADPSAALADAASLEDETYARMLLDRGARPEAAAPAGATIAQEGEPPLVVAARFGRYRVARRLLAAGADPRARAPDGRTAWEVAEFAYREANLHDARLVKSAVADAGGGPPKVEAPPPPPAGPRVGTRVSHAKFGAGTITAMDGEKWTVGFDGAGVKTLLAKFLTVG